MAERKTVEDYILYGGLIGINFVSHMGRVYSFCKLEVITPAIGGSLIKATVTYLHSNETYGWSGNLSDKEATPAEVKRAKESKLSQKTS